MPDDEFIASLKDQYDKEFEVKARLDEKANNVLTMSGTTATLLLGFGVLLLGKIEPQYVYLNHIVALLLTGVIAVFASIVFAILAYRTRGYTYVGGHEPFFNEKGQYDEAKVEEFRKASKVAFNDKAIEDYLFSIKDNSNKNSNKARLLGVSQWLFLAGILTVPLIVIAMSHAVITHAISID